MRKLLLQWHITDNCNCRCSHCYQENTLPAVEPDIKTQAAVVNQFKTLLVSLGTKARPAYGQITVTGGEPLMQDNFFELLQLFAQNKQYFAFAILTNGTLITPNIVTKLQALKPLFVQVSIEGCETTHDSIRGKGNYQQALHGLRHLVNGKIRTFISFTAHKDNFREFTAVAELGRKLKVDKVWADRYIPLGAQESFHEKMLTASETLEFINIMAHARHHNQKRWFNKTKISLERGLQFLQGGGQPYHCTAGNSLLTLMPNGDVYPCRRMPLTVGNLTQHSLTEIYQSSPLLQKLRTKITSSGCDKCLHRTACRGGLKCLASAVYGDPWQADPGCWYAHR
ncbi:MAG: heme d1 biosynthesis protein [Firmicutes bacterium]|nr:heme d1 biosynthesis protein [Bacillota bacterium]